jgi:hypothetical protein
MLAHMHSTRKLKHSKVQHNEKTTRRINARKGSDNARTEHGVEVLTLQIVALHWPAGDNVGLARLLLDQRALAEDLALVQDQQLDLVAQVWSNVVRVIK